MRHIVLRWGVRALLSLFTLLLLVFLLLVGGLFTNSGLNTIVWGAQKVLPELEIKKAEGAIFPRFTLFDVSFINDDYHIELQTQQVEIAINASCFLTPSICVDQIKIDGVDFSLSKLPNASTQETDQTSEPITELTFPLPIYVNRIELTDIDLNIIGNNIDWRTFNSQVEMVGKTLTVSATLLEQLNVELATTDSSTVNKEPQSVDKVSKDIILPNILIPLEINLEKFDLRQFRLKGESPLLVNHLGLSAHANEYDLSVAQLSLDLPELNLEAKADIELRDDYPLELEANARLKQTELKGQKLALKAMGSVAKLDLDAQFNGVIEAILNGEVEPLKAKRPFDFKLSNGAMQWPLTGDADYSIDISHISAEGSLDGYQVDAISVIEGETIPHVEFKLSGKGDLTQIDLESIHLNTLGGEIAGQVMANWQAPINWQANLDLKNIQPGLEWQQAEGIVNGSLATSGQLLNSGGWQVALPIMDINGVVRGYPLDISGSISASDVKGAGDVKIETNGLSLKHGPNGIQVSGQLDKSWNIDTKVDIPDIHKTIPELEGSIEGQVALRGGLDKPDIRTSLSAKNITYLDVATIASIDLSGELSPLPAPKGDLTLEVGDITHNGNKIDSVVLSFSGAQEEHQLSFNMLSELLTASFNVSGKVQNPSEPTWRGELGNAVLSTKQGSWKLDHPVALGFVIDSQIAEVQAHCWLQESSKVCLSEDLIAGKSGKVSLEVKNFDFKQIDMFLPSETSLEGVINASTFVNWSQNKKPNVKLSVELPQGNVTQQLEQPVKLGWESVSLNAQLYDDMLTADWMIDLVDSGNIEGDLKLENVQSAQQTLDARLILKKLNLAMMQPIVGEYGNVKADINSNLKISGPVNHPRVEGHFVVDDIVAQGDITPIEVESGKLDVSFSGYDALLNADLETPDGLLQIVGDANWNDLAAWQTNINVFAEELNVNFPPVVQVTVKPDMTISVTPKLAKVEGDIYLPSGLITVEELPPSAIGVSSDEVILNKNLQPEEQDTNLPFEVETNVNIHIGNDFKLSAFGLEGELVGKVNVTQKDKGPFIVGEIEVVNGSYRSFGQDLIIDKGKVLMNGPVDQPYLAIQAIRNPDNTQDDVVAGIRVTGPANEPIIDVYSTPTMPQQNALSYLLRGQNIDSSSGGNSMTTALIGLSLAKSGRVVGKIGETFGVSDLQLDTAGSGEESQVTVSGYLTPELQVKYGVGIFDSFGEFTVRYKLITDLYLEAVSGMNSAVDLLYQFEFD